MLWVLDSLTPGLDWRLAVSLCLVFLLAGIAVIVGFRRAQSTGRLSDKGKLLELALNNMTQGVVMFDANARLVVCNDRYLKIYDLPPNIVKSGARLADIVRLRARSGSLPSDPDKYVAELMEIMAAGKVVSFVSELPDGRAIAVVNRAIPGGAYWIGTHYDITERRKVEQKNALLGAQEARRAVIEEAIAWFRESVEGVLKTVGDSVAAMRSTASALSAISYDTTTHTAGAVKTSGDAFDSVEVAANAAEEMSKSIAEINHQLARATEVVRAATAEAQSTNADIEGLAAAAQKIDDVIKLIHSVAGQTNLLGAQCHHRSGARRHCRQGLCRGRLRGQSACGADRQSHRRHRHADRRGAVLDAERRARHRQHQRPRPGHRAIHRGDRVGGRAAARLDQPDFEQRRGGGIGHEIGGLGSATRLHRHLGHAKLGRHRFDGVASRREGRDRPARQRRRLFAQGRDVAALRALRSGSIATRAKVEMIFNPALIEPRKLPATLDCPPRRRR